MRNADSKELLTINQCAEILGLKPVTLRQWTMKRKIGFVRVGERALRIPKSEIDRLIERGYTPARGDKPVRYGLTISEDRHETA